MKFLKAVPPVTRITIVLCTAVCLAVNLIPLTGFAAENAILLGAYYKAMITAGEIWRLLTCGLVHISFFHLFVNMYSLLNLGAVMERVCGWKKYLFILTVSVLSGSGFLYAMAGNTVAVGLSGGLYGLMAAELYYVTIRGGMRNMQIRTAVTRTIMLNLMINFMPGIAWQAHFGGAVAGLLAGMMLLSDDGRLKYVSMSALVILSANLYFAGMNNTRIRKDEIYLASDIRILQYEADHGLSRYAGHIAKKLDILYDTDYLENNLR